MTALIAQFWHTRFRWAEFDRVTVLSVFALSLMGILVAFAASPTVSPLQPFAYTWRHLFFLILALFVFGATANLTVNAARRSAVIVLFLSIALLIVTAIIGIEVKGAQRWLPVFGLTLQVSEFAKPALIVTSAWLFIEAARDNNWRLRLVPIGLYVVVAALLLMQPDVGQTALLTIAFGVTFFMAGMGWRWIATFATGTLGMAIAAFVIFPHVSQRLGAFLNPDTPAFQTQRALAAIREGGFFGKGPGEGVVKHSLPDAHTDFAFSVAAEEYGAIFCLVIAGCILAIAISTFRRALRMIDPVAQLSACALVLLYAFQSFINLGVNLNLVPPKGMTLPFISYGGSSLLASAYCLGLIVAFTRRRPGSFSDMTSQSYW
jgi:cell division protein FtsW